MEREKKMRLNKKRSGMVLFAGLLALLWAVPRNVPGASKACGKPKSEAEIRALLQKWRDQVRPGLPALEVKLVEEETSPLPVDLPAGQLSVTFEDSETKTDMNIKLKAQRRDMAYALAGFGYTFLGGNFAGQEKMKDVGFWCFLEACLLKMISPHLLNVGFHLNERGAYDDALSILCYAAALNPKSPAVHNNLAYNLAAKGNFKEAVDEAAQASSLEPGKDSYTQRLKHYGQQAGLNVDHLMANSGAPDAGQKPYSQAYDELLTLLTLKYQSYSMNYLNMQTQSLFMKYFSGGPGSARAAFDERLIASEKQNNACLKACQPQPGIIPAGLRRCQCQCDLAYRQRNYSANAQYYQECAQACQAWSEAALKAADLLNVELAGKIEARQKALSPQEFEAAGEYLDKLYFQAVEMIEGFIKVHLAEGAYPELLDRWKAVQDQQRECAVRPSENDPGNPEDFFGRRPPMLRRKVSQSGKPWNIWFFFGELRLYPDDTARLSLGRKGIASLKFKFNFRTYDFGAGVGLGLNAGKLMGPAGGQAFNQLFKFEFFAMADSKKGLNYGLETGLRTLKYGPISMGDQVVTLEN